jgi:putative hydrolase of the HAD superfamily
MIRAILFDMGGTLDGDGLHWLDRFAQLYAEAGVPLSRAYVRNAFDEAERHAAGDDAIAVSGLDAMIQRHVGWQLEYLDAVEAVRSHPRRADLQRRLVDGFVIPVRASAAENVELLAMLSASGLQLGVVSNGCGNVDVLCAELGYAPYLSVIVDSRRVGLFKPDPAIFVHGAAQLGVRPSQVLMVGDSFDRDIRPAKSAGLLTAWLEGPARRACPDPSLADFRLRTLAELPAAIDLRVGRS